MCKNYNLKNIIAFAFVGLSFLPGIKLSLAQNLVPNGGFESLINCPIGFSEFNGYVSDWVNPSNASPDYMNACANPFPAGVPHNGTGFQQSHGGDAYAGCYLTGGGFYTEYIQVPLTLPMVAGSTYSFSMYVVLHNNSEYATDDIGAYFSVGPITSPNTGYLAGNPLPQISNPAGNIITDTLNWQLISGTYVANGGENYLTLGHFKPDSLTTFITLPYGSQGSYYYFDDVSVESMSGTAIGASDTAVCEKFCLDFFDQSTNSPVAWEWTFPGGVPSFSTAQNPVQICYPVPGIYDVTLITTTAAGNDTLSLSGYVTVNATPAIPVITQNGLELTSSPAFSYQWQLNGVTIAGATNQTYTVQQTGLYTVEVSSEAGCKNVATLYVEITGIGDIKEEPAISVYPNPSHGLFTIAITADYFLPIEVNIKNALGQQVRRYSFNAAPFKEEVNLSTQPSGIYFIEVKSAAGTFIKKVRIE